MINHQTILIIVILSILYIFNHTQDIFGQDIFFISSTSAPDLKTYESNQKGINILYPSNWIPMETEFGILFAPLSLDPSQAPAVSIFISSPSSNSVEELVESVIRDTTPYVSEFNLVESNPFTLSGNPGHKISFTHFDPNTETTIQTLQVFTIKNGKDYGITYQASAQEYSNYLPIVNKMINSFKFIDLH